MPVVLHIITCESFNTSESHQDISVEPFSYFFALSLVSLKYQIYSMQTKTLSRLLK